MSVDRARRLGRGCLALLLAASQSQALDDCDAPRAVALDVAPGAASSGAHGLEQSVIAELGASEIAVCAAPERVAHLVRVHIRATLPDWQRASIRLESASEPALERELDVSKLPLEARALAIASATDELVRSAFSGPSASVSPSSAVPGDLDGLAPEQAQPERLERDRARADGSGSALDAPERLPSFEAGLVAAGSSHAGQRQALEADLAARYWLLPRLPLSARFGGALRMSRPPERGDVLPGSELHAALGAGFVLWSGPSGFDLIGDAAVQLSRVGFDEGVTVVESVRLPGLIEEPGVQAHTETHALDHGWSLAASLGLEGRLGLGPVGLSLALAGLAPIVPPRSDWGDQTSLDEWGVQVRGGFWMRLGSRPVAAIERTRP